MSIWPLLDRCLPQSRRAFALGMGVALAVLACTVIAGLFLVRTLVRHQIARRDATALHAVVLMEQLDIESLDGSGLRTDRQLAFDAAVRASRLRNVLGIRFYEPDGRFHDAFPATIQPEPLKADALANVQALQPNGRYEHALSMASVFIYLPQFATGDVAHFPALLVTVPLHEHGQDKLLGIAQFIVEGEAVAAEYRHLDRRLAGIALLTYLVAGTLLVSMLSPAFRRMSRLNRELAAHARQLERANEELALTAKVSAVGAVSAHLMHGLKNPLASLTEFVRDPGPAGARAGEDEWQDALAAARRMQDLVGRTMEVLNDVRGEPGYDMTVRELGGDLQRRLAKPAEASGVEFLFDAEGNCRLSSRTANLAGLILVNLLENAVQATPSGGRVELRVTRQGDLLLFRVCDQGRGFPAERLPQLFLPGRSDHEGGSGIGLAISKQVADYLGAVLELEQSGASGCVFLLKLPMSVCIDPPS